MKFALSIPISTADKITKHPEKVLSTAKPWRGIIQQNEEGGKTGKKMPCVFLFTYFICLYARKLRTIADLQVGFLTQDTHKGFALLLCFLPHCHLFEIVCVCAARMCVFVCVHVCIYGEGVILTF